MKTERKFLLSGAEDNFQCHHVAEFNFHSSAPVELLFGGPHTSSPCEFNSQAEVFNCSAGAILFCESTLKTIININSFATNKLRMLSCVITPSESHSSQSAAELISRSVGKMNI